jgi:hypothetical protein
MRDFLNLSSASAKRPLWIDSTGYTARLLEGGNPPWLEVAQFLAWQRKAQGLVCSDVIALQAEPLIKALIGKHPQLLSAMAGKPRVLFPLKTLLAEALVRAHLNEAMNGLRSCFPSTPVALVIPSPRRWVALTHAQAVGANAGCQAGADEFESASVYVADFLRAFGGSGIDALLLEEAADTEPSSSDEIEWYRPVLNVASHYRWTVGLRLTAANADAFAVDGVDFFIASHALAARCGISTPPLFWTGGSAPLCSPGQFRHVEVPVDANPEFVLDRLASLREQGDQVSPEA